MISEQNQRRLAAALTAVGWFWTAYECDTIGIDVFDMLLKRFPGQVWIMAAVLTYLTIIWMPKNLLTRSVMGIFMLIPAELFKLTRPMLPDGGFAPVQIVVAIAYVLAVIGMYGMFYPWRIETALKWTVSFLNKRRGRRFPALNKRRGRRFPAE